MQGKIWSAIVGFAIFSGPTLGQGLDCAGLIEGGSGNLQTAYDCIELYETKIAEIESSHSDAIEDIRAQVIALNERVSVLNEEVQASRSILKDAVVAFHRSEDPGACPNGWTLYRQAGGRILIGAGEHSNAGLTTYPSYVDNPATATGGEEVVTLTVGQLPTHNHKSRDFDSIMTAIGPGQAANGSMVDLQETGRVNLYRRGILAEAGNNEPHNNMPPYIALYFCKKD